MTEHEHPGGIEKLNELRLLGGLKAIVELLGQHDETKWVNWFQGDFDDYLAAKGPPLQAARQMAVIVHILTAFGGMSKFDQIVLLDESGKPSTEENDRLHSLAEQIWLSARGMQAHLASEIQHN